MSGIGRRPRVAFLANGEPDSAMAERAESFAARLRGEFTIEVIHRTGGRLGAAARMLARLARFAPDSCYVLDAAASGVAAAGAYKHATGTPFAVDTGDAIVELGRALGRRRAALLATRALDVYSLRAAATVVVRGSFHRELLAKRGIDAAFIPDGVDVDRFAPKPPAERGDPSKPLVIGLVGSSVWVPARQTCYGCELIEVVRLLRGYLGRPVRGVLIGDGSGVEVLRRRCHECGLAGEVEFPGRVPYAELPRRLRGIDVCLSTQTDDVIGNVRTTGKLPLYLAAGRFVLASRVGEAARVLPPEMLVEFAGESDPAYPERLASRLAGLVAAGTDFSYRPECVALAREHFDYDRLAVRLRAVLLELLMAASGGPGRMSARRSTRD
jgi:glycosyltransferase involved in cell wall biosynthesis